MNYRPEEGQEAGELLEMSKAFAVARLLSDDGEEAERLVTDAYRKRGHVSAVSPAATLRLMKYIVEASGTRSPESARSAGIVNRLYPAAFSVLSRPERVAVYLTEFEGFTAGEVGVVLGIEEPTARFVSDSALEKLKGSASPARRSAPDASPLLDTPPPARRSLSRDRSNSGKYLTRAALALALIVAVGLLGRGTARLLAERPPIDFLSMTERALSRSTPHMVEPSPEQASSFLSTQLGRPVSIPAVRDASLDGVGVVDLRDDLLVPILYYANPQHSEEFKVAVFTYEQIDRLEDATALPPDMLSRLEVEESIHVSDVSGGLAAVWRFGADVYVAVGPSDSIDSLSDRLTSRSQTGE